MSRASLAQNGGPIPPSAGSIVREAGSGDVPPEDVGSPTILLAVTAEPGSSYNPVNMDGSDGNVTESHSVRRAIGGREGGRYACRFASVAGSQLGGGHGNRSTEHMNPYATASLLEVW